MTVYAIYTSRRIFEKTRFKFSNYRFNILIKFRGNDFMIVVFFPAAYALRLYESKNTLLKSVHRLSWQGYLLTVVHTDNSYFDLQLVFSDEWGEKLLSFFHDFSCYFRNHHILHDEKNESGNSLQFHPVHRKSPALRNTFSPVTLHASEYGIAMFKRKTKAGHNLCRLKDYDKSYITSPWY